MTIKSRRSPGYIIKGPGVLLGSFHWTLGKLAWAKFEEELRRPQPIYDSRGFDGNNIIGHTGPTDLNLDIRFEYTADAAAVDYEDGVLVGLTGLGRIDKRYGR